MAAGLAQNLEVVDFLMPFGLLLLIHATAFFSEMNQKIGDGKGDTVRRKLPLPDPRETSLKNRSFCSLPFPQDTPAE